MVVERNDMQLVFDYFGPQLCRNFCSTNFLAVNPLFFLTFFVIKKMISQTNRDKKFGIIILSLKNCLKPSIRYISFSKKFEKYNKCATNFSNFDLDKTIGQNDPKTANFG